MLVGMGVASALGDRIGVVPMFDAVGVLYILAGLIVLAMLGVRGATPAGSAALSSELTPEI
jgi:hypothetical protein